MKNICSKLILFFFLIFFFTSCDKNEGNCYSTNNTGAIIDIDGNRYDTIVVNGICWFKSNLRVSKFNNGDLIPNLSSNNDWANQNSVACCSYNNNPSNDLTYGKLYNSYIMTDARNVCPVGWRIAGPDDWSKLFYKLGVTINSFGGLISPIHGGSLKSKSALWDNPNIGATDTIGFSAMPAGSRILDSINVNSFSGIGSRATFWASDWNNNIITINLNNSSSNVIGDGVYMPNWGLSVRCVKNL